MRFMASAQALFIGLRESKSYHEALRVNQAKKSELMAARRDIRATLRERAKRLRIEDRYWDQGFAVRKSAKARQEVDLRFLTQGSMAYDLLIAPAHLPPQELDLDDGMYVRVDYLESGQPALIAKALFDFVEEALGPLCVQRGWTIEDDKDTCVRVQLDSESHIDIPIYSAPRELAVRLEIAADQGLAEIMKRAGTNYIRLPSDQIMLAHRDGTWEQSDPLRLEDWVENCVTRYGETFRRLCRYYKGWRDNEWPVCCLKSITVMAAVADAFEQMNGGHRGLDDDVLIYELAQRLPDIFRGKIYNPAFPGQNIVLNDWNDDERLAIVAAAEKLERHMESALKRTAKPDIVVSTLRAAFGTRIPNRPDAVKILPALAAAVIAAPATVVAAPKVKPSISG